MPIRLLTAFRKRCFQPRYHSVVSTLTWHAKLNLFQLTARLQPRSREARGIPQFEPAVFMTSQLTSGLKPFTAIRPSLFMARKIVPEARFTAALKDCITSAAPPSFKSASRRESGARGQIDGFPVARLSDVERIYQE